jgi:hypothetical protein
VSEWHNIKNYLKENKMGGGGLDSYSTGYEPLEDFYEHGNKPSGSIKF